MRIDIMTLFPDAVEAMMGSSIIGRARERGFVTIQTHQIRDYTTNKQMQVDDYPYGGGRGAVMQADPLYRCWQHICDEAAFLLFALIFHKSAMNGCFFFWRRVYWYSMRFLPCRFPLGAFPFLHGPGMRSL